MAKHQSTSNAARIQRFQDIAEAYLNGESMESISRRLGVGIGTVHRDLKAAGITSRSVRKDDIQPGTAFGSLCSCGQKDVANSTALRLGRHVRCAECRKPAQAPEAKTCTSCKASFPNTGEMEFLTIDHIENEGKRHRDLIGEPLYRFLTRNNFPSDVPLRVLCFSCNQARGFYGSCPHEKST